AGAQVGGSGQVGDLAVGGGPCGTAVIERDGAGGVVRHGLFEGLRAGAGDVTGGDQRAAQAQTDRAEGVLAPSAEGVGIGDDVLVGRSHEHALDLLPGAVGGREREVRQRLDGGRYVRCSEPAGVHHDLGQFVVLGHITGDLHVVAEDHLVHGRRGVDEYGLGGAQVCRIHVPAGSGGLDVVAVEPAFGIDGGDHAGGRHGLPFAGRGVAGALNLCDGDCLRRRVLVAVVDVTIAIVAGTVVPVVIAVVAVVIAVVAVVIAVVAVV